MINYEDFKKIELRIAQVLGAERVIGSEKLIKIQVDLGTEKRQIIAGIAKAYEPSTLVGKQVVVITNLEPRSLMGLESQGMVLATSTEAKGPFLLIPDQPIDAGAEVR